ncbi:hypothetical protein D4A47_00160 [Anaerotruncus massiliensis (ex Liu et al. 2021)]|uniref:Uncharacterized protein n=2 Tax=Anaerotruncus TaxID=244127 RepID=A0A498CQK1_9FIRM|nr:DUF6179 domain-containing protein [Anaerotruncus massiliensis (ex Liu et al. 2021)]MBC3937306.1 hypothetical protein [Anaerotruncus massiliensis (ex Togo et al. 2019)]RLL14436.1 hypothetical protein D4A47_00160 [Anaerotruncus massiliensis (ex Liu et al. 2021)]
MENRSLLSGTPLDGIDYGVYTASLMRRAADAGLLDERALAAMQEGLLGLLRSQIEEITRGESSSVPAETADQLMDDIGYCIDVALKHAPTPQESLALLREHSMDALYRMGTGLLDREERACEGLLSRVRATRTPTVNEGYRILLDVTFPQYLRDWKVRRHPGDFVVLTEYPLAREVSASGIFGVRERLESLALENRFCGRFAPVLDGLLRGWARQNRTSPAEAYVNLFTITLQNLLLARLLGREDAALGAGERAGLEERLRPLAPEQRAALLLRAAEGLIDSCAFENARLNDYIREGAARFAGEVNRAGGALTPFAVVAEEDAPLLFIDGERLGNDAFSAVADEVLLCDDAARKAQIIREELRSLDDLCDLLGAGCVYDDEYAEIFSSFDEATAALLLGRIRAVWEEGALRPLDEIEWQEAFANWFNRLGADCRERIRTLSKTLAG